ASLVAGSGVDINIMMPVNKTDNSKFVFLLCTRLIAEKGVMEFIAAAKELSGQFPKAAFRIIGKPAIHPNAIDISIITKYQREGVIEYFEEVDNISEALSNADVLVHPSYYKEGIPRILLEGLSKGLPIITTNSVGCKETVDHLKNGLLVEPKNIASLVNAMHYMLNASAAEMKEMSNYSRQKAVNQFDERIVIDEYLKYFPSGIFSELKTTSAAAEINRPRKIRQIIVVNRFVIGGPVMHIASRIDYNKSGYDSLFVVGEMDEGEKEATHLIEQYNLKIVHIKEMKRNISPWNDYIAYIKMKKLIRSFNPDIVDTHAAKAGLVGRLAAFKCKVPVITHTFHGHVFHSYFGSLKTKLIIYIERWLAKKATAIIAVSELQKKELAEVYKICTPEKIKVLPIGLAVEKFQQDSAKQRCTFRKEYFLDDDEVAIGIIGRIVPIKNHTYFLRLAKAALQQTKKKLRFFIIGDGSIRHQLEREAEHLLLSFTYFPDNKKKADIIFTSWIIDIETAYAGLDIIALTSLNEGTPVSLIEAQAAGKPVISTAVGGVNDVMINNETGFCIEPADFQNFTDKLIVLAENESLRNEMGCKGKKFSEENYSTGRVFAQTHKYYKECLEKAGVI
ncbi:MAG TPA: glycosyltransferase, partial [Panacibacter sp.]|nr:glycosyltransferase [Panacibacter sp.]